MLRIIIILLFVSSQVFAETNTVSSTVVTNNTPPTANSPSVVVNNSDVCKTAVAGAVQTQRARCAGRDLTTRGAVPGPAHTSALEEHQPRRGVELAVLPPHEEPTVGRNQCGRTTTRRCGVGHDGRQEARRVPPRLAKNGWSTSHQRRR